MIKIVLILITIALCQPTLASSCFKILQEIVEDKNPILYNHSLDSTGTKLINHIFPSSNHYDIDQVLEVSAFNDFLIDNEIIWDDDLLIIKKKSILQVYLEESIEKLQNLSETEVFKRQDQSLKKSLLGHGVEKFSGPGYKKLQSLSTKNLNRIKNRLKYSLRELPFELETYLKEIELRPIHNTHVIRGDVKKPILSSYVLEEILGKGGFNTDTFNKEIMESDDNIFFYASLKNTQSSNNKFDKRYGNNMLTLDRDHLLDRGWVSLFVMYPEELNYFGSKLRDYSKLLDLDYEDKLYHYKSLLSTYDFTPKDYEELIQLVFKEWIIEKSYSNPEFYKRIVSNPSIIFSKIDEALKEVLGFQAKFEVKVPILIETKYLKTI